MDKLVTENFYYTLKKYYKVSEISNLLKNLNYPMCFIQPKYDGVGLILHYSNSNLVKIETKAKVEIEIKDINFIPKVIPDFTGMIRGELLIDLEFFKFTYPNFKYGRNVLFDLYKEDKTNGMFFVAYDVEGESEFITEQEKLKTWGFQNDYVAFDTSKLSSFTDDRLKLCLDNYILTNKLDIDGLVIIADIKLNPSISTDTNEFRIAYKIILQTFDVQINDISVSKNRFDQITQIASFNQVEFNGSIITKVNIGKNRLRVGDKITIGMVAGSLNPIIIN